MRLHRVLALLIASCLPTASLVVSDARADFDPEGRRRPTRPTPGPARPTQPRPAPTAQPTEPSSDVLIQRYMGIVLSRPSVVFPLQRLAQLYRERDGNLDQLVADLNKRAQTAGADQWAAKVALAGIFRIDNKLDDASRAYREVIAERPNDPGPIRALAEVMTDAKNLTEARQLYEQAMKLVTVRVDQEDLLRRLMGIALDQNDYAGAKRYHDRLVAMSQGSIFVRAELGRELAQRGDLEHAEVEYRELVKAAAGDNRALAPALRDLGGVLVKRRKTNEAIDVLRRALAVAGQQAGVRNEIHALITEAYRAESRLPELIALLETSRGTDFHELTTLGLLYEETGQVDKALETYRRALRSNQRHIDTRLKVIHLLQAKGELDEAIREYESLIRAVPSNTDFVFELCEILIQRGDRVKALQLLTNLEQRTRDDDQLARVADFYERIEEGDKAMRIMQRLAGGAARDPRFVIDLGDRYFQQGEKQKALDTWARLRTLIPNRAEALATLGEVYLDHDMPKEALEAFRQAVALAPDNLRYLKSLATALERTAAEGAQHQRFAARYGEALQIWQQVLTKAAAQRDEAQAREARLHIVTLWSLSRELSAQVAPLARSFGAETPDVEAGRMLAEVQIRLQRLGEAEATLKRLTELRPGDSELFLSLERVYVLQQKLNDAIELLKRLVKIDPKRARQYYQRMAQYAAELYRDEEAVAYAAEAVALAPDDAEGHRKLGEMYRRRQDNARAVSEFRAAIARNDRLFLVYFDLAELLLAQGNSDEADSLYRRVLRASPDEELVARATRLSMQLNLGKGTLEVLERELLPAVLGHPQKTIYRRLLVDLYGAMAFPLVQQVSFGKEQEAAAARDKLTAIGTRAVKPLLDALADDNQAQQMIAIEVLAFVENRSAGPALFAYATGNAEASLRIRAMIACGALRDPQLLPRYKKLLIPDDDSPVMPGGPIAVAAAWGVARMRDPKAMPLLRELADKGTPELRGLALLGLGFSGDAKAAALLGKAARSAEVGNVARAAAAYGMAEMGASSQVDALLAMSRSTDALPREAALVALSKLAPERAEEAIAAALFESDATVRQAAVASALVLATGKYLRARDPFVVPDRSLDVRAMLREMVPSGYDATDMAKALAKLEPAISRAATHAVQTSPERATLLADALLSRGQAPGLAPFTDELQTVAEPHRSAAERAAAKVALATTQGFIALVRHPSVDLRIKAVRVLARQSAPEAQAAVVDALTDDHEQVQRAALAVLGEIGSPAAVQALASILSNSPSWSLRLRAAHSLAGLNATQATPAVREALSKAAQHDGYALVRQAAIEALAATAPGEAKAILVKVAESDEEPRVREVAGRLLKAN